MKKIVCLCLILMISSCGIFKKKQKKNVDSSTGNTKTVNTLSKLAIRAGDDQLDVFKIGKSLSQLDLNSWKAYNKSRVDAGFFGFDGGGKALLYTFKDQPVAAVLTDQERLEIKAIVAIHPDIITDKNISVKSTLKSIKTKYPEGFLEEDSLNGWYHYVIKNKEWKFVFDTSNQDKLNEMKSSFLIIR